METAMGSTRSGTTRYCPTSAWFDVKPKHYGPWRSAIADVDFVCAMCADFVPKGSPALVDVRRRTRSLCGPCGARHIVPYYEKREEVNT
jgi:hypothetical protein